MLIFSSLQPENGGVVMVNFYSDYIVCKNNKTVAATLEHVAGKNIISSRWKFRCNTRSYHRQQKCVNFILQDMVC